ncbi:MAG: hypothetical protein KJZ87_15695 [Thermoguttaceae bacterium]|nr:hypothetical protein [Thermoguttaceae bacterium]
MRRCPVCQGILDATELVCSYCQEKATRSGVAPLQFLGLMGVVAIVATAAIMARGNSGAAKQGMNDAAREAAIAAGTEGFMPEEPQTVIMSPEEAGLTAVQIKERLIRDLDEYKSMVDFNTTRMKTNGVLELQAFVEDNPTGRRMANFVSAHILSRTAGRYKVRGLALTASDGKLIMFYPCNAPLPGA